MEAYSLPHECEREGLAALLAKLTRRQRSVLRAFMWQVEFGGQTVTAWLDSDTCPISRTAWYRSGDAARYWCYPPFQRALDAYRKAALEWQTTQERREVTRARSALLNAAPAAAGRLVDHSQGDMGVFLKVVERWTGEPQAAQEILEEETRTDDKGVEHRLYKVRMVVVDLDKVRDPRYSRYVRKLSDSPRAGLSIELYDAQQAAESILDRADLDTASKAAQAVAVAQGGQANVQMTMLGEVADDELDQLIANLQAAVGGGAAGEGTAEETGTGSPEDG